MKSFTGILWVALLALIAGFTACSESMDLAFDESETRFISINAYTTSSFESEAERKKQDTIVPGDSLIFLTAISPSKSIRLQRYYWNLDGELFANEFSFKSTLNEPGIHNVTFVLIDFFGDTLRDSVTLYVASHPVLDKELFIPRNNTQGISPRESMNFVWTCDDRDSLWRLYYHFTLANPLTGDILVDTLLDRPQFTFYRGLDALSKYKWTVQARNELDLRSAHTLEGTFYTAGTNDECAITGILKTSSTEPDDHFDLTLLDSANSVFKVVSGIRTEQDGSFILKAIPPGKYTLKIEQYDKPDFEPQSRKFTLIPQTIHELSEIVLKDTIPPTLSAVEASDTLDYQDTLKFIVKDGGGAIKLARSSANFDGNPITAIKLKEDTLLVPMPSGENIWTYKILNMTILDLSHNKTSRAFYLRPRKTFDEVAND